MYRNSTASRRQPRSQLRAAAGGASYWNLSGEPTDFFNTILKYYP